MKEFLIPLEGLTQDDINNIVDLAGQSDRRVTSLIDCALNGVYSHILVAYESIALLPPDEVFENDVVMPYKDAVHKMIGDLLKVIKLQIKQLEGRLHYLEVMDITVTGGNT